MTPRRRAHDDGITQPHRRCAAFPTLGRCRTDTRQLVRGGRRAMRARSMHEGPARRRVVRGPRRELERRHIVAPRVTWYATHRRFLIGQTRTQSTHARTTPVHGAHPHPTHTDFASLVSRQVGGNLGRGEPAPLEWRRHIRSAPEPKGCGAAAACARFARSNGRCFLFCSRPVNAPDGSAAPARRTQWYSRGQGRPCVRTAVCALTCSPSRAGVASPAFAPSPRLGSPRSLPT